MKKIILLLTIICTSMSCTSQKESVQRTNSIKEILFSAHTRGTSKSISVVELQAIFKNNGNTSIFTITDKEKKQLLELIKKLNLKSISQIEAPSNKRHSDGTLHASLTIKTNKESFTSSDFDDGNPPAELKDIINLLQTFSQE
ncbi:hypothetical protein [uncultured Tenacibaculum sp.]|uniref:hypothetical protein n=1 Tax=uncultured Tenacibaculum sp. TaxID=174713 RepID=UPI0026266702|nr:hypothetical protein [uncultured Tenacibaculum sp.]